MRLPRIRRETGAHAGLPGNTRWCRAARAGRGAWAGGRRAHPDELLLDLARQHAAGAVLAPDLGQAHVVRQEKVEVLPRHVDVQVGACARAARRPGRPPPPVLAREAAYKPAALAARRRPCWAGEAACNP